jgi:hypothetical protein
LASTSTSNGVAFLSTQGNRFAIDDNGAAALERGYLRPG